jgi:hypothetical protein
MALSRAGEVIKLGRHSSYTERFVRDGAGNLAVHATRLLDEGELRLEVKK